MKTLSLSLSAALLLANGSALLTTGCGGRDTTAPGEPSIGMTSKPAEPDKPVTAGKMAEPGKVAPRTTPQKPVVQPLERPIDKTPIVADLSKIKFTPESELFGWDGAEDRAFYYTGGLGEVTVKVPADGEYEIVVKASCQAALNENAKFVLSADGQAVGPETTLASEEAKDYRFAAALKAGERKIGVKFTNDAYKQDEYDRNFYLHSVRLARLK